MRTELIADLRKKLEVQKNECVARITEFENSDPFNLAVSAEMDDDRSSPDDEAQLNEQHERVVTQIDAQKKMIIRIDNALERMSNGSFGVCEVCGKEIEESRLLAMPLAALCLHDEKSTEKRVHKRV